MAKRRRRKRRWPWVLLAVIVAIGGLATYLHWPTEGTITISPETTYILGPMNDDGTVNYVAYIDQRLSKGVTKDNNAAVLLVRAFGPEFLYGPVRGRILSRLEMDPLPANGKYFVELNNWMDTFASPHSLGAPAKMPDEFKERIEEELEKAGKAPWAKADFPQIAAWLDAQAKPLELVIAASQRSRYYMPLLSPDNPPQILTVILPSLCKHVQAAKALSARAMLKLGADDLEGAWADILAVHRLGALVSNGGMLRDNVVGISVQKSAISAGSALAASGKLSAAQARAMLADLQSLPPLHDVTATINEAERFNILDCVMILSRGGDLLYLDSISSITEEWGFLVPVGLEGLDTDEILRTCNAWYDRVNMVNQKPTFAEWSAGIEEIAQDLSDLRVRLKHRLKPWHLQVMKLGGRATRAKRSKLLAELLVTILMPSLSRFRILQDQARMGLEVEKLAFALAACRAEKGEYPAALSELSPAYLKDIPNDLFTDKPLKYRLVGKGYVLYSVGYNLTDDGGRTGWDNDHEQDDIGVRVKASE